MFIVAVPFQAFADETSQLSDPISEIPWDGGRFLYSVTSTSNNTKYSVNVLYYNQDKHTLKYAFANEIASGDENKTPHIGFSFGDTSPRVEESTVEFDNMAVLGKLGEAGTDFYTSWPCRNSAKIATDNAYNIVYDFLANNFITTDSTAQDIYAMFKGWKEAREGSNEKKSYDVVVSVLSGNDVVESNKDWEIPDSGSNDFKAGEEFCNTTNSDRTKLLLSYLYQEILKPLNSGNTGTQADADTDTQKTMSSLTDAGLEGIKEITDISSPVQEGDTYDVDSAGNTLNWARWYIAAFMMTTDSGLSSNLQYVPKVDDSLVPVTDNNGIVPLYGSFQNLVELVEKKKPNGSARRLYEILSIIAMADDGKIQQWTGKSSDELTDLLGTYWREAVSRDNSSKYVFDADSYDDILKEVSDYINSGDAERRRFATIGQRLKLMLILMSQDDRDMTSSDFSWLNEFYGNHSWTVYEDMITDNSLIPMFRVQSNTDVQLAGHPDESQYLLGRYLMHTLCEVPYYVEYYLKDMNELINSKSELTNEELYRAVKSLKEAKEDLKMPMLDYLWEKKFELDDMTGITYASLDKIWDAMNGLTDDATSIADAPETKEPLETGKPLKWFFSDYQKGKLSDYYLQGIGYTATLVPMRSNVYSKEWLKYMDYDFFINFYYRWGFNRKALFIDKSSGSVENYFTQETEDKTRGRTKVCTLRDLIESKGDVTLYLDDNFYNCAEIQERYKSMSQTSAWNWYNSGALDKSMATDDTTAQDGNSGVGIVDAGKSMWWANIAADIEEMYGADFENIVKTNESTNYSKTFYDMMSKISGAHTYYPEATATNVGNGDNAVLSSGRINYYLNSENTGSEVYTPIQGYAVVSSIYRDADLFNKANSAEIQRPVFMASQTAPYMKNASLEACETIFNWAMLKNLKEAMPVGYAGNIDMDCPVYMDILGNIITESGTVVIPAAANATIMNPASYYDNMYAAGLFAIYGMDYYIPRREDEQDKFRQMMSIAFEPDDTGKYYIASPRTVGDSTKVDMSRLSATSKSTLDILYQQTWATLYNMENGVSGYNFDNYFNICLEVLRGAPIESIDKVAEGIDTSNRIDRAGIVAAAKLEELNEALATGAENTTLYIPNLAFMPGLTYVAMMAFKVLMLVVILVSMMTVYFDAVSESLGVRTVLKCISALLITMITLFTVPAVFEATYYQSNRALLQDEAVRIAMLNYEKDAAGVEIGVTEVKEPEITTKLYLQLQSIDVPWYELFYNSIFTNSYASLEALYEDYAVTHSYIAGASDVEVMNDGVYVDIQKVFDSSSVDLNMEVENTDVRRLVQTASTQTTSLSFYSPYYAILDALIQNVNYFNDNPWGEESSDASSGTTGWYSYTMTEQKGGKVKTMGLIEPYFTSDKFLYQEAKDPLGLRVIYEDIAGKQYAPDPSTAGFYSQENLSAMRKSAWYAGGISSAECDKRLDYMTESARRFVAKNRELIGKISDDTFLKAMALSMAMDHNKAFGVQSCDSLELYNLSNDDLIRLSIADRDEVMINSTLSYPRFVYTVGGSPAVFAAALLSMVMWISGIVKPLLVVVAFVTIFVSIFIFRVCMRKEGTSLYGYMITALLLSFTNICYSLMLKASMFLPSLHFTPFMCILVQIVLQITYMVILLNVVGTAFKDWRDLGYARYAAKAQDAHVGLFQFFNKNKNANNPFYGGSTRISDPEKNWSYYDDMMEERKRRSR